MRPEVLVIYDSGCRACRWGIESIARIANADTLRFCPFGHPSAERELLRIAPDERYRSMHAVVGGELFSGIAAARVILRVLPFGSLTTALGIHWGYPLLARFRGVLGRFTPDVAAVTNCGEQRRRLERAGSV